jgi:phospholipid/cholesterol/gamma-HCH transport system substrate-binding protein
VASYAEGDSVPTGPPSADINEIMDHVDSIGRSFSVLTKALEVEVVQAGTLKELHRAMAAAATFSLQLQAVTAEQSRNFTQTLEAFRQGAIHLSNVADSVQIAAMLANTRQITENTARLSANIDSTNTQIRKLLTLAETGNGTVGKLLGDSLLYTDGRSLLQTTTRAVARMDSLLADFKANPKKYINVSIF